MELWLEAQSSVAVPEQSVVPVAPSDTLAPKEAEPAPAPSLEERLEAMEQTMQMVVYALLNRDISALEEMHRRKVNETVDEVLSRPDEVLGTEQDIFVDIDTLDSGLSTDDFGVKGKPPSPRSAAAALLQKYSRESHSDAGDGFSW